MKVFNKEVSCCNDCPMIDRNSDRYLDPKCNLSHGANVSDKNKTISKDCPFNKPITKEVIEGFGFKFEGGKLRENFLDNFNFKDKIRLEYWYKDKALTIININRGIFEEYPDVIFKGTINNPIELEFILKSIGVIE